jgi:hypothetical protein
MEAAALLVANRSRTKWRRATAMPLIMWLLGVPLSLIVILWLIGVV